MKNKTKVVFKIFKGEVLAVFKDHVNTRLNKFEMYAHDGQHGEIGFFISKYRNAKAPQYKALKNELISIGYTLEILNKE